MSQPFIGQLSLVGFNFAPLGWNICQGQLISISSNEALYALIGTTYGGDGQSTFQLPNLQGRIPVHQGPGYTMGMVGGSETVTILAANFPSHTHALVANASSTAPVNTPGSNSVANGSKIYKNVPPTTAMSSAMVGVSTGGNLPHNNIQPYQALNWIIAMEGIFPTQN